MDLGYCRLRRAHCNILYSAIHSTHGVAWTDGRVIYLAPVSITSLDVDHIQPLKLGEFEHVESMHWSSEFPASNDVTNSQAFSYMCVLHKDSSSLWKVTGASPNLSFKQVRKIHIQTIMKGCLWNPNRDILCLLSKEKASFYFNHSHSKGSYSLPSIESGQVSCGCWSGDGRSLVLGVGSVVLIYQWQDIDESITDYTIVAWKIPGVTGQLNTLASCGDDRILCTAELPLEQICSTHEHFFDIPDLSLFEGSKKPSHGSGSGGSGESSNTSTQSQDSDMMTGSTPSHISSLLNLKRNTQGLKQDSSQLIMFGLQGRTLEPYKIAAQSIQGVLAPDLLYWQDATGTVVVGSNTHTILAVFNVQEDTIVPGLMLQLNENERPKGLCGCIQTGQRNAEGILVAVAAVDRNDNAFLSVSMYTKYKMSLRYFSLPGQSTRTFVQNPKDIPNSKMFREIQLPNGSSKVHLLRISPLKNQTNINENSKDVKLYPEKLGNNLNPETRSNSSCDSSSTNSSMRPVSPLCNLVLPGLNELVLNNEKIFRRKVVPLSSDARDSEELEVETQNFDEMPRDFKNMKLVQMFEPPPVTITKRQSVDNLVEDITADTTHVLPCNRDVFMTSGPSMGIYNHSEREHQQMEFPEQEDSNDCSDNLHSFNYQSQELISRHFDMHKTDTEVRTNSGKASISISENSAGSQQSPAVTRERMQDLEVRMTQQETALYKMESAISSMKTNISCAKEHQYSGPESADLVFLTFVPCKDKPHQGERKAFLLDQGRLQLHIVKEYFAVKSLEMLLGEEWCVVGCDSHGYIPLLLRPRSSYSITGALIQQHVT